MHAFYVKLLKTIKPYVEGRSFNGLEMVVEHRDY